MSAISPAHSRRHPMTVVTRARELVASGWSYEATARMLAAEGATVSACSVRRWTNRRARDAMEQREQLRQARKAEAAGANPMGPYHARPEFKLGRMRTLRDEVGLKDAQIARVMRHDFGDELTRATVARALETGRYPRSPR